MANIRRLKKDIDAQIYSVISDCFTYSTLYPDERPEEVTGIISDAVNLRNELIHRINNPSGEADPKGRKVHYQMVNRELTAGVDKLCERLSSVSKKRKK
ncbi:MAG: hypothetical protein A2Z69_02865 [Bacteroidetes bacterium RBG_13_44_24]|nr:MAG: hypothetical protein A2Z69_02865 [Bacteroidetes bacterium RBG_13_44_24]